ncbi:pilus assembly protein PilE [Massilia eurypsychrophila]|jgi:type IV pilus assembly protein PilE|uniref:Pilus assembly protein PilE n=1 Tax=Massilia eurypsychrophila TaxID=1485217 RepID=A0A2G8TII2_9BURK|nr:type IV pilin protein [Massilia eurypsychrophila]PIL45842.1 pilus assembly protein PilE [Massilia eurypsychrophila]
MNDISHQRAGAARQAGVTLIELMVVLVIIGIISAIAYPSYTRHVLKSNRSNAQAMLMENAQFLERYYTVNNTYAGAAVVSAVVPKGATGSAIKYNVSFSVSPSATVYTVQAVPANSQAGDACGTLTLAHTGAQTPATGCW